MGSLSGILCAHLISLFFSFVLSVRFQIANAHYQRCIFVRTKSVLRFVVAISRRKRTVRGWKLFTRFLALVWFLSNHIFFLFIYFSFKSFRCLYFHENPLCEKYNRKMQVSNLFDLPTMLCIWLRNEKKKYFSVMWNALYHFNRCLDGVWLIFKLNSRQMKFKIYFSRHSSPDWSFLIPSPRIYIFL